MKILIDENKYLTCFCVDAELNGGIEVNTPEDIDTFADEFRAYKYDNGQLTLDPIKLDELNNERLMDDLRHKRERNCFTYVNRGELWYSRLSEIQKEELSVWYQAWLDVTTTKIIPDKPDWLI